MPAPTFSDAEWAAHLAAERAGREHAEAALAAARQELAALKEQLAGSVGSARQQHAQLTALVQNLRVGLVLVGPDGEIRFVNHYFWELFGLPPVPNAETGGPIARADVVISKAFRDPVAFGVRAWQLHAAGQTVLQEAFALADGRVVELDYLVLDTEAAGRLICYRDVTERHQREAELHTLSFVPEQNPNPILRLTPAGEVVYANPAAAPMLQALAADAQGQLPQRLLELVQAALRTPEQHLEELTVDGQHYLFTGVAVPGQAFVTLYLTNVTARQQAEQQLAEQRAFYESLLEQVPSAVAVFDAAHRYLFLNPVIEPDPAIRAWMVGKTSDEACAYRHRPVAVAQQRAAAFAEAVRTQQDVTWEETRLGPDGHRQYFWLRFRPVHRADGVLRVICSGVDITERKLAEEKIAHQQEFYESILNLLPVDVAVFDAQHRFLFVNPSAIADPALRQQVIGLSNAEYMALREHLQPPGVAEQREEYFRLAARTRADVTWEEMRTTGRDQRPQLIMRHFRPVYEADGSLRLVVGSGIDITARYTAEKLQQEVQTMLQVQQVFIRQILDALPNVVYLVDPDNTVSFSNKSYDTMIAHSQHWQAMGAGPAIEEEMRRVRELNELVRTTKQVQTQELPFTLNTGETLYYHVHKRPMMRADGQLAILTVSTDVTAVKKARQALESREKQYHDLVYYSQALICTHDLEGKLLSVNPAIERLLGVPARELIGTYLGEALNLTPRESLQAYFAGENPEPAQDHVISIQTRAGERRYLRYYTYQVLEAGVPPYVVASGYDVTPGVLAERALQRAKHEAEENARAKEAFLARMSHEIRTPLNGVLGMAGLLQKTPLTDPQREYLTTMQHAGQHLLALLNDVLDMAKITTHNLQLSHQAFDLATALQAAGQTVAALAAENGLQLRVEANTSARHRVVGDAYRLHQVLLNLLSNAIKFTQAGSVQLGVAVVREMPDALLLRFWVQDTGIGIAPDQQAGIFDAFAQASAETSLRYGGTGLGLTISQQLVDQMGGTLRLCSEPGVGTTFAFQLLLPRATTALANQLPTAPAGATYDGLRGLRVLLAEDNAVNQRIAVAVLECWGVQVVAVGNGLDALAQLQTQCFDAAILDIRMPGLSGVEVTTAIRQHPDPARAQLPIMAMTANAFEADRAVYLAAGMNACLTKPYEEAALCQLLLELTK